MANVCWRLLEQAGAAQLARDVLELLAALGGEVDEHVGLAGLVAEAGARARDGVAGHGRRQLVHEPLLGARCCRVRRALATSAVGTWSTSRPWCAARRSRPWRRPGCSSALSAASLRRRRDRRAGDAASSLKNCSWAVLPMVASGLFGVLDAGQRDRDLVAALLLDLRLGDAQAVDAAVEDADRLVELRRRRRLAVRRLWPCRRPAGRPGGRGRGGSSCPAG